MKLGISLGIGSKSGVLDAGLDPRSLSATGLWLPSYTGAPWLGSSSAGSSSGRNLSSLVGSVDAGSAVNGYAPADFGGASALFDSTNSAEAYLSTTQYTVSLVLRPTAASPDTTVYLNPGVLTESGANWGIVYSDAGLSVFHQSAIALLLPVPVDAWSVVDIMFSGGTLAGYIDGELVDSESAPATGTITGGQFRLGQNFLSARFQGQVLEVLTSQDAISADDIAELYKFRKAKYQF